MTDVFADVWCPYAHLGIRRFIERRRAVGRRDLPLHVRAWPLELVNGEPLDAGHVARVIDDLRGQVAPDLFTRFDPERFPSTTLPALELVADAYLTGIWVGEHVSLAVREALFERGQDISDPKVLMDLRRDLGVGAPRPGARALVLADWREGRRRGVVGSPHFFVDGLSYFCPTLRIEQPDGKRKIEIDTTTFDEFFEACAAA